MEIRSRSQSHWLNIEQKQNAAHVSHKSCIRTQEDLSSEWANVRRAGYSIRLGLDMTSSLEGVLHRRDIKIGFEAGRFFPVVNLQTVVQRRGCYVRSV